jgi:hypothetical protein
MKLALLLLAAAAACAADLDRDGIDDRREQGLAEQFAPSFHLSRDECDTAPAEFAPGSENPKVVARNGAIYFQVFPTAAGTEIHYYHLWSRDCGRRGHALDVEHVSALVGEDGKARYWYAAAHKDTICDSGHGAKAAALGAEERGPDVWISRGKHASFLSLEECARACGSDRCDSGAVTRPSKLVNVGEPGAPLNGALWISSRRWPFALKMKSDFGESVTMRLDSGGIVRLDSNPRMKAVVSASGAPLDAMALSASHTTSAVGVANGHTDRAVARGLRATGRSLNTAARSAVGWLSR